MEQSTAISPRMRAEERSSYVIEIESDSQLQSMNALEILRETLRILRFNSWGFISITALLICPVSAVFLSNVLVDESMVLKLSTRLLLIGKSSGLPLKPFIRHSCRRFSEMVISSITCFPLFITFSLISRAAIVYSVDCTYSRKKLNIYKFGKIWLKIWKRIVSTYLWCCGAIVACLTSFLVLLLSLCSIFYVLGISPNAIVYAAIMAGLVFSVIFANAVVICDIGVVISVLEDVSGAGALLRSGGLIKGQTHVGLLIFLGSTIGMAVVEGLFEHRVKTLSSGDGSSPAWEGPLLVVMYSAVVLVDSTMSAVFYFSCRSSGVENLILQTIEGQTQSTD